MSHVPRDQLVLRDASCPTTSIPTQAQPTMAKAESSKAGARNAVKANPNAAGGANYELPW
jgi:hypothetical protein